MSVRGYDSFLVTSSLGANRKVRRLTPAERWCAVHGVWAIAAESPERGTLWIADGVPATEKDYSELAGVSIAVAKSTVRKMRELGMLEMDDGAEHVHDWDQHQREPKPSDSPESRRDRKRKSRERHADVTRDNGQSHAPEVEVEDKKKNSKDNSHVSPLARLNETAEEIKGHSAINEPQRVFDAWVESTGKTSATKFDAKRKRLAVARLKEFPIEDLLDAARGWKHSPHHRGENSTGTVYNDFGLIYRDAAHVEMFRDLERASVVDNKDADIIAMNARAGLQ